MVPFFSGRILGPSVEYRPQWARPALMAGAIAHGVLEVSGLHTLLWIVDFPFAIVVMHLAIRWGLGRSASVRLLSVLHISLAMLALALALSGALSVAVAVGALPLPGLAPLHLVTIGYFAAMLVGMVSRVSLGHSGRALEADTLTWSCYLGVLATALLRAGAEFAPPPARNVLMASAAVVWLLAFGFWGWRYMPMYLRPRVDAQ
jgi:uncharacterized protein involved in response to NO